MVLLGQKEKPEANRTSRRTQGLRELVPMRRAARPAPLGHGHGSLFLFLLVSRCERCWSPVWLATNGTRFDRSNP